MQNHLSEEYLGGRDKVLLETQLAAKISSSCLGYGTIIKPTMSLNWVMNNICTKWNANGLFVTNPKQAFFLEWGQRFRLVIYGMGDKLGTVGHCKKEPLRLKQVPWPSHKATSFLFWSGTKKVFLIERCFGWSFGWIRKFFVKRNLTKLRHFFLWLPSALL